MHRDCFMVCKECPFRCICIKSRKHQLAAVQFQIEMIEKQMNIHMRTVSFIGITFDQ